MTSLSGVSKGHMNKSSFAQAVVVVRARVAVEKKLQKV